MKFSESFAARIKVTQVLFGGKSTISTAKIQYNPDAFGGVGNGLTVRYHVNFNGRLDNDYVMGKSLNDFYVGLGRIIDQIERIEKKKIVGLRYHTEFANLDECPALMDNWTYALHISFEPVFREKEPKLNSIEQQTDFNYFDNLW